MGFAAGIISGHQAWAEANSMLKNLYSEETGDEQLNEPETQRDQLDAKLRRKEELRVSYCSIKLGDYIQSCCCCFISCFSSCRKHVDNSVKFKIAHDRYMKEYDLFYMIKMNRMNKILHKVNFLKRQKQMIPYSGRYIVT